MINILHFQKEQHEESSFPLSSLCRFSLYLNTEKRLHHKRNDTDTIQELSPISKRIASN